MSHNDPIWEQDLDHLANQAQRKDLRFMRLSRLQINDLRLIDRLDQHIRRVDERTAALTVSGNPQQMAGFQRMAEAKKRVQREKKRIDDGSSARSVLVPSWLITESFRRRNER